MADQYSVVAYLIYRTGPFSTTLNDPEFNVIRLFNAEYLRNDTR